VEELSTGVKALLDDLDAAGMLNRSTVVIQSEFGRRLFENADRGTDHGHGNLMVVAGGNAVPGIHGTWPGLANAQLFDGADLEVTTDFRPGAVRDPDPADGQQPPGNRLPRLRELRPHRRRVRHRSGARLHDSILRGRLRERRCRALVEQRGLSESPGETPVANATGFATLTPWHDSSGGSPLRSA
jgi:hypothetical protein